MEKHNLDFIGRIIWKAIVVIALVLLSDNFEIFIALPRLFLCYNYKKCAREEKVFLILITWKLQTPQIWRIHFYYRWIINKNYKRNQNFYRTNIVRLKFQDAKILQVSIHCIRWDVYVVVFIYHSIIVCSSYKTILFWNFEFSAFKK